MFNLKLISKTEYKQLQKDSERIDNYSKQIVILNDEINKLRTTNDVLVDKLFDERAELRKQSGRVGGLTKSNHCKDKKISVLIETVKDLKSLIKIKNDEVTFYKKYSKNPKLEKAKNYIEISKECERRAKYDY